MDTKPANCDCIERPTERQVDCLSGEATTTKKCPFCAEPIQAEAIKCRYCGEFLAGSRRSPIASPARKWYFATGTVVMALLCLGPLGLPLVWINPHYKLATKAIITVIVLVVAVACMYLMAFSYRQLLDQFKVLGI